jgi:hypothetical protein
MVVDDVPVVRRGELTDTAWAVTGRCCRGLIPVVGRGVITGRSSMGLAGADGLAPPMIGLCTTWRTFRGQPERTFVLPNLRTPITTYLR